MNGVLGSEYLQRRKYRREYIYRYKVRSRMVAVAIDKYLKPGEHLHLLDLGAAEGLTMLEIDRLMPGRIDFVGIEHARELIEDAPELPGNIRLEEGDINRLAEEVELYDVVSALAVLEHLSRPVDALRNAVRALKPGGIFIATVPAPRWDHLATSLGLLKADQHQCDLNLDALKACFEQAGMKVVEYDRFMWAPVAVLPYLGLKVSPALSLKVDALIRKVRLLCPLFVNQYVIGMKPLFPAR